MQEEGLPAGRTSSDTTEIQIQDYYHSVAYNISTIKYHVITHCYTRQNAKKQFNKKFKDIYIYYDRNTPNRINYKFILLNKWTDMFLHYTYPT